MNNNVFVVTSALIAIGNKRDSEMLYRPNKSTPE
jgi:hypothetical protein